MADELEGSAAMRAAYLHVPSGAKRSAHVALARQYRHWTSLPRIPRDFSV